MSKRPPTPRTKKRVGDWTKFLDAVAPFVTSARPLDELRAAGVQPDGVVAEALANAKPAVVLDSKVLESLQRTYGPPPTTRVRVDKILPNDPPPRASGYGGVASVDLGVFNQILSELWRVHTTPHEFSDALTDQVITLAQLKATCTGVPEDGVLGRVQISQPPVLSASVVTPLNAHLDVAFAVPVVATVPAALEGVLRLEIPLDFQIVTGRIRLSLPAIEQVSGALEVGAASTLQPRSDSALAVLESAFTKTARTALLFLRETLSFPGELDVAKKRFPNSTVDVTQFGAASVRRGATEFAIVGINVESPHDVDPSALATQAVPVSPFNVHAVVEQGFATDALAAMITSGDLAAFFNRVMDRHSPVDLADVAVTDGRVVFEEGQLRVSLDCVWVDACAFGKDLKFRATVSGTPSTENGTLSIETSEVDFDLDNTDAVLCALLGAFLGPFSIIVHVGVMAFLAAFNPSAKDLDIPVAGTADPLPGSDKVVDIELTRAVMTPGALTGDGVIRLIDDPLHTFVYLRVVSGLIRFESMPLVGATVELYELDDPPPDGDDVSIPPVGESEEFTPKFVIQRVMSYEPLPDQHLGTAITDENGEVNFVAVCNARGGIYTEFESREDVHTGEVLSSTTRKRTIGEAQPDLAVTIRSADGRVVAKRRLIAPNLAGKRLGAFDNPVVVRIKPPAEIG